MTEILKTLVLLRRRLNEYLSNAFPTNEDWVALTNLVEPSGDPNFGANKKVVMFLAGIQHETSISTFNRAAPTRDQDYVQVTPPLYLNLYLLFFANFHGDNYPEGLAMISATIRFFQQNPFFNHKNLPGLDRKIDKLTFEITNLDLTELNYLMGLAGVKYLPSVYYKVRGLPFDSEAVQREVPALSGYSTPGEVTDPGEEVE